MTHSFDLILVGGGLSNSLVAHRLASLAPETRVLWLEKSHFLGGNHTWSFHQSDLTAQSWEWMQPLLSASWDGYDVAFPARKRTLLGKYASIASTDFHEKIHAVASPWIKYGSSVAHIRPLESKSHVGSSVELKTGEKFEAPIVLDGRAQVHVGEGEAGYQRFVGLEVELMKPHGLTRPILMDAMVEQKDGYRFFYVLPFSPTRLLVEDTRYSNFSWIDQDDFETDIQVYIEKQGWKIRATLRRESAALPLPMCRALFRGQVDRSTSCFGVGMGGGWFHPVTGYSLPDAVRVAEAVGRVFAGPGSESGDRRRHLKREWRLLKSHQKKNLGFYLMLNRMMFHGAEPSRRFKIFERFYGFRPGLIDRFYSGHSTTLDKTRILVGKPPVSIARAARLFFNDSKVVWT